MRFLEREISFPKVQGNRDLLSYIEEQTSSCLSEEGLLPIRIAVTDSFGLRIINAKLVLYARKTQAALRKRSWYLNSENESLRIRKNFNVVFLIPTGIGCEIGGHAGDATPVARLLSSSCDNLITHPNVFNASDLNEMPENSLYVEGSTICRLMMGTVGLQPVRSNRILAIIDEE